MVGRTTRSAADALVGVFVLEERVRDHRFFDLVIYHVVEGYERAVLERV